MSSNNLINIHSFLEREKLNVMNFFDWHRDLTTVLKQEGKDWVLENPIPVLPKEGATIAEKTAEKNAREQSNFVTCFMLINMNSYLQRQFENMDAYNINLQLKKMFELPRKMQRILTMNAIIDSKLEDGNPVGRHVRKMIGHFEAMECLGCPLTRELATDIILHSLHDGFNQFRNHYLMYEIDKPLDELFTMLQTYEQIINSQKPKM